MAYPNLPSNKSVNCLAADSFRAIDSSSIYKLPIIRKKERPFVFRWCRAKSNELLRRNLQSKVDLQFT